MPHYMWLINCITTVKAANLRWCEGSRTTPSLPHCVPLALYQCQMFYESGAHRLLTCLNKASRSTKVLQQWQRGAAQLDEELPFTTHTWSILAQEPLTSAVNGRLSSWGREGSWNIHQDICWEHESSHRLCGQGDTVLLEKYKFADSHVV